MLSQMSLPPSLATILVLLKPAASSVLRSDAAYVASDARSFQMPMKSISRPYL